MRLAAKKPIDPSDPNEFTRPVRLHRRDPRLQPPGREGEDPAKQPDDGLTPEERAKQEAERIAKEKEREEILASIAPSKGERSASKRNPFKKKTMQVFHKDENDRKLRYEEYFPWHIEDFDYKNTWVGNLESGLSNGSYAMFVMKERSFQMVPIEKWYKFTQRNVFKNFTIEEAENLLKKKAKPSRWLMDDLIKKLDPEAGENGQPGIKSEPRAQRGMFLVKGERLKQPKKEVADADELDFEDDFQDDEEAPIMDGDEEENKATEVQFYASSDIHPLTPVTETYKEGVFGCQRLRYKG
jgi:transcription initiation factor TFIIF subunit alpha